LKTARQAIETFVATGKKIKPRCHIKEKRGVFVSIHKNGMLRACMGLPYPVLPLSDAIVEAAVSACNDPRFPPLSKEELKDIDIEVSILTEPELIESEPAKHLEIGRDGLIIESKGRAGLLLPQVATEYKWNPEEFLRAVCIKAGLPENEWRSKDAKIYKFQAQILREKHKV